MQNHIEQAMQELLSLSKLTDDKKFQNYVIVNCSNYYDYKRKSLLDINEDKQAKNKSILAVLELTDEVELHFHKTQKVQRQENLDPIGADNLNKLLNLFKKKSSQLYRTDEKELEELYNFKVQLYNQIFQEFDNKLFEIPNVQKHYSSVLFNRIISYEKLEKVDVDAISTIRHSSNFKKHERELIVSALSISTQNVFDTQKLHLLIDFLTDFEEDVWQRALVGIVLTLYPIESILPFYEDITNRLLQLREIPQVQSALYDIERILRRGLYRPSKTLNNITDEYLLSFYSRIIDVNESIPSHNLKGFVNDEFYKKIFDTESLAELVKKEEVSFMDLFKTMNLREYFQKNDLSIWSIDYSKHEHFKKPQNWLLPFYENNPIILKTIEKSRIKDINLKKLTDNLLTTVYLDNFEKYSICLDLERYDKDMLIGFEDFDNLVSYLLYRGGVQPDKNFMKLTLVIRELYRYNKFFSSDILNNIFHDKIELYKSKLISNLSNDNSRLEIIANASYEEENYLESIDKYKQLIESAPENEGYKSSLANCYYHNNDFEEAKELYEELINISSKLESKIHYFERTSTIYQNLENEGKSWEYKIMAAQGRERHINALNEVFKENEDTNTAISILNNLEKLSYNLNLIGVWFCNQENYPLGLFHFIKSANYRTVRADNTTNDINDIQTVYTNIIKVSEYFINNIGGTTELINNIDDLFDNNLIDEDNDNLLISYFKKLFQTVH
ncbi:MAG: tetratricopeptide repeat protein, partial [Bacteroidota bacterium]